MSDLRERVARAMAAKDSGPEGSTLFDIHWHEFAEGYLTSADAAIALVLEEAAKMIETHANTRGKSLTAYAKLIAAAIRAMKGDANV